MRVPSITVIVRDLVDLTATMIVAILHLQLTTAGTIAASALGTAPILRCMVDKMVFIPRTVIILPTTQWERARMAATLPNSGVTLLIQAVRTVLLKGFNHHQKLILETRTASVDLGVVLNLAVLF